MKPGFIQALSRRPQGMVIAGACTAFVAIAYIPISEFYLLEFDDVQKNIWVLFDWMQWGYYGKCNFIDMPFW